MVIAGFGMMAFDVGLAIIFGHPKTMILGLLYGFGMFFGLALVAIGSRDKKGKQ